MFKELDTNTQQNPTKPLLRVCEVNGSFSECPHCKFLSEIFCNNGEKNDREYWLMTEVFVYLHKSDVCNFKILQHGK